MKGQEGKEWFVIVGEEAKSLFSKMRNRYIMLKPDRKKSGSDNIDIKDFVLNFKVWGGQQSPHPPTPAGCPTAQFWHCLPRGTVRFQG